MSHEFVVKMKGDVSMKKTRLVAAFLLICSVFSISAGAADLDFGIRKVDGAKWVRDNTKDLSGNYWYLSNYDIGDSNFVAGKDIVGFRVWNGAKDRAYSEYEIISDFTHEQPFPYSTTPNMYSSLWLRSQVDSNSYYSGCHYVGAWLT